MADTPYYQNGQYNPGLDPRPFSALTPAEQAARAGGSINIPADQIKPATPIATVTTTPTDVNGSLASAFASLPNPNQAAIDQTKSSINDIVTEFGNQSAYQAQQENAFGVNTDKQAINDLQGQLRALNAESAAKQVGIDNQPILSSIASGQAAQEEKLRAIKALSISGQIEAMQGNLQLALDQVDRAMKLKYDPLKTKLDLLNQQLQDNYDSFNAEEKRRANQLQAENDIKLQQLKDQQAQEKTLETTIVTALSNGAPLSLVTQARQLIAAGNTDAALASLHAYTGVKSADVNPISPPGNKVPVSGNKLTLAEATKYGLPKTLVGRSETDVINEINTSTTAPKWFAQITPGAYVLAPGQLDTLWMQFRGQFISGGKTTPTSNNSSVDYGVFNLPTPTE